MEYVDDKIVEGFKVEASQQFSDAATFAANARQNDGDSDENELRQAAQDALLELTTPLVSAMVDAYQKSPLKQPDYPAIALVFNRLAIRADLYRLLDEVKHDGPRMVRVCTRGSEYVGKLQDAVLHEGEETVWLKCLKEDGSLDGNTSYVQEDEYVPTVAIMSLTEVSQEVS